MRILLVEDDLPMAHVLRASLQRHGLVVDLAHSLALAAEALRSGVHDLMILDRGLPDGDGVDFIQEARALREALPIILLTARGEISDRVEGLDEGADDYVTKPVATDELLARVRAIARRPAAIAIPSAVLANLAFDFSAQEASVDGRPVRMPRRHLLILEALMLRLGRTVRREVLHDSVFGFEDAIQANTLDAHISKLRRSLDEAGARVELVVIRGVGYLLKEAA
jgi:two-component system, OmpR family, response regulator